jgi:diguanylate cyclase (GGDEF)-like protein
MNIFQKLHTADAMDVEHVELRGFSRSIAELEWLLLILVILYTVVPGNYVTDTWLIIKSCLLFGGFVLAFRYLNFYKRETRWKMAIELWVMIAFITWILWHTGKIDSPLLNLYLLVIITSGLTMGKVTTFLILLLITCVYIYMGFPLYSDVTLSLQNFGRLMTIFSPYLLIAYLTTMLSADLQYARRMFKYLSETDDMTGLDNIRSFNNTLTLEIKKAERYEQVFSLMMIDADNLKNVNDKFGHEAGDRLIKAIAATIQSCLRESDTLARYGGDEFIALLTQTKQQSALEVAERIRQAVENTAFDMDGHQIKTTVSIGISCFPIQADNTSELLRKTDQALYMSKNAGRNKVTLYTDN